MSQGRSFLQQEYKIMEKFDFERVQKCMKALDWQWLGKEPTLDDLKNCASNLMGEVQHKCTTQAPADSAQWFSASTGGFKASAKLINGNWWLVLEFIVESYEDHFV